MEVLWGAHFFHQHRSSTGTVALPKSTRTSHEQQIPHAHEVSKPKRASSSVLVPDHGCSVGRSIRLPQPWNVVGCEIGLSVEAGEEYGFSVLRAGPHVLYQYRSRLSTVALPELKSVYTIIGGEVGDTVDIAEITRPRV